jgi:maltokinase
VTPGDATVDLDVDVDVLRERLPAYLAQQRWFAGGEPEKVDVEDEERLGDRLLWLLVDVDGARYQLLLGAVREGEAPDFLHGQEALVVGVVSGALVYDGLLDAELAGMVLEKVAPSQRFTHVRPMGAEQSNTSLVFDDETVLKVFRRVHEGANPDVEVTSALASQGFEHVAAPIGVWERDDRHLAVAQPFLAGASEGWALALTSLRDLFANDCDDPAQCGGDFAAEAARLGEVTARMHLALAAAFGARLADVGEWSSSMGAQLARAGAGRPWAKAAAALLERLGSLAPVGAGASIRVHGDYHLGQVLRGDAGWFVLDFEGEPARPLAERRLPSSPLKDVAGMLRSFDYAVAVALRERGEDDLERCAHLGRRWEQRNREAFLEAYLATDGIGALLPRDMTGTMTALHAWELDKAVYEVGYEEAHRPEWVSIPAAAIERITSQSHG